jgi:hypothetical protein
MASTSTEINQASSTKLSEEAKQKLLELQTQLQEQQNNSENSNYIKFKKIRSDVGDRFGRQSCSECNIAVAC